MKIFNWKKDDNTPSFDPALVERLNSDLNYCGFNPQIQKGFLFFLGAGINVGINESPFDLSNFFRTPEQQKDTILRIINSYSPSSGDFSDYGDLNDGVFSKAIYTGNFIFFQLSGLNPADVDNQLRNVEIVPGKQSILLKSDVNEDLVNKYKTRTYNLNICHNLLEDLFGEIGSHLDETGYDNKRSYEAGYAYFCMQAQMDIKGVTFLFATLIQSLTPLYKSLFNYPLLNFAFPEALKANHIFSNTLQMFYGGMDQTIVQPIHRFHQFIFYMSNSASLRPEWDFENREDEEKEAMIFLNAITIRKTEIMNLKSKYLQFDDFMCPDLKHAKLDRNEFYNRIRMGIYEKYMILPVDRNQDIWNNLGDLIQYFGILFYETCLHSIVLDELTEV
jgi:hypothetical protein